MSSWHMQTVIQNLSGFEVRHQFGEVYFHAFFVLKRSLSTWQRYLTLTLTIFPTQNEKHHLQFCDSMWSNSSSFKAINNPAAAASWELLFPAEDQTSREATAPWGHQAPSCPTPSGTSHGAAAHRLSLPTNSWSPCQHVTEGWIFSPSFFDCQQEEYEIWVDVYLQKWCSETTSIRGTQWDRVLLLFFSQLHILGCFWSIKDQEFRTKTGKR